MSFEGEYWDLFLYSASAVAFLVDLFASGHAILTKRDTRAAVGWVGFIWVLPVLGALFYVMLGINRIHRRARAIRAPSRADHRKTATAPEPLGPHDAAAHVGTPYLAPLARLTGQVSGLPLTGGNCVDLLQNGDEAYPAMLAAIAQARRTVLLASYIFDRDRAGHLFLDALRAATARGVEVRVLIDAVGSRYSVPSILGPLRDAGVRTARFNPGIVPWRIAYANLRSHRKAMVVDGVVGFTGGLNIRQGNLLADAPRDPIRDIHARVEGPVVAHLTDAFLLDWRFATGELLPPSTWCPPQLPAGDVIARGLPDGPDEDLDVLSHTLLGALSAARDHVWILTPYFVPDGPLMTALRVATLRGVEVNIITPERPNLTVVTWAARTFLRDALAGGCRVHLTPPPFDHAKLMIVDGAWTCLGSGNWDARSLRLNFELNVECYDRDFAARAQKLIDLRLAESRRLTLEELDARGLAAHLRDGVARLMAPYL